MTGGEGRMRGWVSDTGTGMGTYLWHPGTFLGNERMAGVTVSELAGAVGGTVVGDGSRVVEACNTLMDATEHQVSLLHNAKYAKELETTRAGCVIVSPGTVQSVKRAAGLPALTVIEAKNTYYAWQQAMVKLQGYRQHEAVGISPLAVIHPTAVLANNV